ncbi:MAG: ribbon-helix-helix domain-containing protein [Treponema sp.]|nr:ribbon-helix-helix domain-containing protein [Treponema sp.]
MTTIRLPYDMEEKLNAASRAQNRSKSEFVREALAQYFAQDETEKSSWEVGEPYFGKYGSGDGNLSVDYKNRLKDKIRAKRRPG